MIALSWGACSLAALIACGGLHAAKGFFGQASEAGSPAAAATPAPGAYAAGDPDIDKAEKLIAAGNPLPATYLLSRALLREPRSVPALNALAQALLTLGDPLSAQVAARRATGLDGANPRSLSLLGDSLTALGDLPGAEAAYRRSLELRFDPIVRRSLDRIAPSGPAGAHLLIRYEGGINEPLGQSILEILDSAYREFVGRLGLSPRQQVTVVLQTESRFGDGRTPYWAAGISDGTIIRVPVRGLERPTPDLRRVLRHELAHSFVSSRTGNNCPTWLQEGIAQWLEGGDADREDGRLGKELDAGRLLPLASLEAPFAKLSESDATLAYAESLSAVACILRQHGEAGVVRIIEALADQLPAHRALPAALGQTYLDLQQVWEAHLRAVASTTR